MSRFEIACFFTFTSCLEKDYKGSRVCIRGVIAVDVLGMSYVPVTGCLRMNISGIVLCISPPLNQVTLSAAFAAVRRHVLYIGLDIDPDVTLRRRWLV